MLDGEGSFIGATDLQSKVQYTSVKYRDENELYLESGSRETGNKGLPNKRANLLKDVFRADTFKI